MVMPEGNLYRLRQVNTVHQQMAKTDLHVAQLLHLLQFNMVLQLVSIKFILKRHTTCNVN